VGVFSEHSVVHCCW